MAVAAVLCVLAAFSNPLLFAQSGSLPEDYRLGVGNYRQKRWKLAAESFREFLKENPRHEKAEAARLYLGISLENDEQYSAARTVFREFLQQHPESGFRPDVMYRVGECSYFLDETAAAEREFSAFQKTYPEHKLAEWALPYLADVQLRRDKPAAALVNFLKALEKFPQSLLGDDSRFGAARCYEALNQTGKAAEIYKTLAAKTNSPRAAEAQLNLGAVYFENGDFRDSASAYDEFPRRFPEDPQTAQAALNAGYAYYELGEFDTAVERFDAAAQSPALAATAGYWKGVSLKSQGRFSEAADVLKAVSSRAENDPLAPDILFQWADSELRGEDYQSARKLFLDFLKNYPQNELAADSLHFAAESALLQAGERTGTARQEALDETGVLLERFGQDYPSSRLRMHHELLKGRLLAARDEPAAREAAVEHFQKVIRESTLPRTQSLARFHLARAFSRLDDHRKVIETTTPLLEQVKTEGAASEFLDALLLKSSSEMALKEYDAAVTTVTTYLDLQPQGDQADQALATRAAALASLGTDESKRRAQKDLDRLLKEFPESPATLPAFHQAAEIAYAGKDWDWAAALFETLVDEGGKTQFQVLGLSGLGWSRFEQKQYAEAASAFELVVKLYPEEPLLAPESAFKRGESLEKAGQLEEAAGAYSEGFRRFSPASPGRGDEQEKGKGYYAYRCGLQAARVFGQLKQIDRADAAYEKLLKKFSQPVDLDKRLDEWALLNYQAGRFARSDGIFRRLAEAAPNSELADNARFSLAESDLQAGRLESAQKAFQQLAADDEADEEIRATSQAHLVEISVEQQDWKQVATLSAELLKQHPDSKHTAHAQFYRAEALFRMNQFDEAAKLLEKLRTSADPEIRKTNWYPRVWILSAELALRNKRYDDVEQFLQTLRSGHAEWPLLYQADEILGRSLKNRARFAEARQAFGRVLETPAARQTETAAKSQFLIAETFLLEKKYSEASEAYLKVYHLYDFPEWQAPALFQAAACDESLRQWGHAADSYEELVRKFPESTYAEQARKKLPVARNRAGR